MARQTINVGASANDGTGDNLRQAGTKMNANFTELYTILGGDAASSSVSFNGDGLVFEGATSNDYETTLLPVEPTADNTIYLPNASGNIVLDTATQTLTNKTLTTATLSTPKIVAGSYVYNIAPGTLGANRTITLPNLTSGDVMVTADVTQTLTNKTLTSPILNSAKVNGSLNDVNGLELFKFTATTSAVNEVTIINAATGNAPQINATGDNTNVNLSISAKGTGRVVVNKLLQTAQVIDATTSLTTSSSDTIILNGSVGFTLGIINGVNVGEIKRLVGKGSGTATLDFTATLYSGSRTTITQNSTLSIIWDGDKWHDL